MNELQYFERCRDQRIDLYDSLKSIRNQDINEYLWNGEWSICMQSGHCTWNGNEWPSHVSKMNMEITNKKSFATASMFGSLHMHTSSKSQEDGSHMFTLSGI